MVQYHGIPPECGRVVLPRTNGFSNKMRTQFISHFVNNVLNYYDTVIYTDCDEFIIPDKRKYRSLTHFLEINSDKFFNPIGFNVVQLDLNEDRLVCTKPILMQRPYCHFSSAMCKPVIVREKVVWGAGFHSCNLGVNIKKDLYLVHTNSADLELRLRRQSITRVIAKTDNPSDGSGPGTNQRLSDEEVIAWYKTFSLKPFIDFDALVLEAFEFISTNLVERKTRASSRTMYSVRQGGQGNPARYRTCFPDAFLVAV